MENNWIDYFMSIFGFKRAKKADTKVVKKVDAKRRAKKK